MERSRFRLSRDIRGNFNWGMTAITHLHFDRWLRSIRHLPAHIPVAIAAAVSELPTLVQLPLWPETADMCPFPTLALKRAAFPSGPRAVLVIQRPFFLSARACCRQSVPLLQLHRWFAPGSL